MKNDILFTIPIKKQSSNRLIKDTEFVLDSRTKNKFSATIKHNYRNAPYFSDVNELLTSIIETKTRKISVLAIESVIKFSEYLGLNKCFKIASEEGYPRGENRVENLINICLQENAEVYVNPLSGRELYSKLDFNSYGVKLNFIQTAPSLSIIDDCFRFSKEDLSSKLSEYTIR